MALVDPTERTAAAAYTGTVRYLTRPWPVSPGASVWACRSCCPVLKAGYDLTLWARFRHVPLPEPEPARPREGDIVKCVTRERPKTDRIACPWLIRRFIDPDAEIVHAPADQVLAVAVAEGAHSFDTPGALYTHRGRLCTFEVLIQEFDLGADPALARLARIVHAADISDDVDSDPLGPGPLAIGVGGLDVEPDDQRLRV
jgi:hypothetical protein